MSKFGTENAWFGYIAARNLKTIVIFEISTLEFFKTEFLAHTLNFGIGSAFSKGAKPNLSEGLVPGFGSLYKVCQQCTWKPTRFSYFRALS